MVEMIKARIHKYCMEHERPKEAWDDLIGFMIDNRTSFVDNNKPVKMED